MNDHHNHNDHSAAKQYSNHENGHSCHEGGSHGMDHGSAATYLKRFWIVTFLLIPLAFANEMVMEAVGLESYTLNKWIGFGLATVIFGFALVFFQHAWHEIKARQYGMMTLVSLAVGAGYLFSAVGTFVPALQVEFYLEISTLIWVLLFGHYLEAKSGNAAGDALAEVAKLLPKQAHLLENGSENDVAVSELNEGDLVLVKPGEKVPADGVIESGSANVNEAHISGESKPVNKRGGDEVIAGSICLDGSLTVRLSRVGENSTVGQIQQLISRAQMTKPRSQRLADRAARVLTFVAGLTALFTLLVWTLLLGETFVFAMTLAITVLVIACPHALGLAIPTVTTITTSLAAKNGFFIKDLSKLEMIRRADQVVFDKTGTLTSGVFGVTDIESVDGNDSSEVLRIAASLEQHSSHIIGHSVVKYAKEKGLELATITDFQNISGKGIKAEIAGVEYVVGNLNMMKQANVQYSDAMERYDQYVGQGKTAIFVATAKEVIGLMALSDEIKPESYKAVERLHSMGIKVVMLTGDNESVAAAVAKELKIDTYFAEVLPEDKYQHIRDLQKDGSVVVMVGDGVNDAPALTQADAGVAIGAGTDVAVEAGDVVLTKNDPRDVVKLLVLSRKVYRKMIQNLFWALGYNVVAIPAAAGAFAYWNFFLRPEIGAVVMSLSTVVVVANAMLLKKVDLS